MLVAGFDEETTGLNIKEEDIIQVACVLWDTSSPKKKAKIKYDAMVNWPNRTTINPEAANIHGITIDDLRKYGRPPEHVFTNVNKIFAMADAVCAHNGNLFDRPFYLHTLSRIGIAPVDKIWIDTSCDIPYPAHITTRKLTYLATEHNFLNPFPHDATSDVLTMLQVADTYDWNLIIEYAKSPSMTIRANTMISQKELAKKQSYRWDAEKKAWMKSIKEFELAKVQKDALDAGFTVTILKGVK